MLRIIQFLRSPASFLPAYALRNRDGKVIRNRDGEVIVADPTERTA